MMENPPSKRSKKEEPEDNLFQKAIKRIWKGLSAQTGEDETSIKGGLLQELKMCIRDSPCPPAPPA